MQTEVLKTLAEVLEIEEDEIFLESNLEEMDAWDSIAILSCIAEFDDSVNIILDGEELSNCKTPQDIISLLKNSN